MSKHFNYRWVLSLAFAAALLPAGLLPAALVAQQIPQPAPVPSKLVGKTVFLSNGGADSGLFPSPFSGSPARAYDFLFHALKTSGTYVLVDDPAKADLVFEIRVTAPAGAEGTNRIYRSGDTLPMARLVVYDRPTHYVLWTVTASIDSAMLQKTHDANFDSALVRMLTDLKSVATPTP